MPNNHYSPGEHNVICQRTGFKIKSSGSKKQWDNLIVRRQSWEPRHPLDFLRGIPDKPAVKDARPRPGDVFLSANEVQASDL